MRQPPESPNARIDDRKNAKFPMALMSFPRRVGANASVLVGGKLRANDQEYRRGELKHVCSFPHKVSTLRCWVWKKCEFINLSSLLKLE